MDMNGHKLQLLASLNILLDERNVTRAAERLGISQPALSAQLARLRDVFGDPLLTPAASGKGMVLTPRGLELKEPLREALRQLDDVVSQPERFDPRESDRTFTIGGNDNATAIIAPRLVQGLHRSGATQMRLAFRPSILRGWPTSSKTARSTSRSSRMARCRMACRTSRWLRRSS